MLSQSLTRVAEICCKGHFKTCIGIDEAGRGPLAGPVVCAAVFVDESIETVEGVMDSKKVTTEKEREETFERLISNTKIAFGVSIISNIDIDRMNILQATLAGMKNSLIELTKRAKLKIDWKHCIAMIDGNKIPNDMPIECKYVIKGDSFIFSIAAASIIAKVTRDRIMHELSLKYPLYLLSKHKGYPTFEHRKLLFQYGPTDIYRFSYRPVKEACLRHGIPLPPYLNVEEKIGDDRPSNRSTRNKITTKVSTGTILKGEKIDKSNKKSVHKISVHKISKKSVEKNT